ncbi:MAG TPA: hypothetical protein VF177_06630 [Anaerolineae bacterium]
MYLTRSYLTQRLLRILGWVILGVILVTVTGCVTSSDTGTVTPTAKVIPTTAPTTVPATAVPSTPAETEAAKDTPDPTATATTQAQPDTGGPLFPAVDGASGFLLGGWRFGQWLDAATYAPLLQDTERPYVLYTLAGEQGVALGAPPVVEGICPQPVVTFTEAESLAGAIGLVARWNATPRTAQMLATDTAVYQDVVAALLQAQGIAEPEIHITGIWRVDLEGSSVDEVLVAATRLLADTLAPPVDAGDYSMVLLRQVVDGNVITTPLALDVYPEARDLAYPYRYELLGLLDLNGDGRLEIVIAADRYEGRVITVYEVADSGVQLVLKAGCTQ